MKYGHRDIRNVLERSSARETTARVAVAGVAKRLLAEFGITILSHVTEIGGVRTSHDFEMPWDEVKQRAEASEVRCAHAETEAAIIAAIDDAKTKGDTLGGVFEVVALGCPVGLGSYVQWIGVSTAASPRPSPPFRPSRASSWASASRRRGALAPPSTTRSSSTPTVAFDARATTPEASRVG